MGQADKLVVILAVFPETSDGYAHAMLLIPVEPGLGHVVLLKVGQELLGSRGQVQTLGLSGKLLPAAENLLLGRLVVKAYKDSCQMSIG